MVRKKSEFLNVTPEQVGQLLMKFAGQQVAKANLRLFQLVTVATPVDLGTARSGWTPTTGAPTTANYAGEVRGKEDGAVSGLASARLLRNQGAARSLISTYRVRQGNLFLSNPVPWIVPLDQGSSAQAPAGFVMRSILTAISTAR